MADVDDILQQTFIDVFRDIRRCEAESEQSFRAWLRAIADHRLANVMKRYRRAFQKVDKCRGSSSSLPGLLDILSGDQTTLSRAAAKREVGHALEVAIAALRKRTAT